MQDKPHNLNLLLNELLKIKETKNTFVHQLLEDSLKKLIEYAFL